MEYNSNTQIVGLTDEQITKAAMDNACGMSSYQTRHFVVGSQLTPYRQLRQVLMELKVRQESADLTAIQRKRTDIKRQLIQRDIDNERDPLVKQLLQCDLEETERDIKIYDIKTEQSTKEIAEFLGYVRELLPEGATLEDMMNTVGESPEEERKYWVARMAKQAAMDMIAYGNIGTGNMEAIMQMNPDDQVQTLSVAIEFTGKLRQGVDELSSNITNRIGQSRQFESLAFIPDIAKIDPLFQTPKSVLEYANQQNLQPTTKSQTNA